MSIEINNEKKLLQDLKSGDEHAFQYFYKLYSLPLLRRFTKLVGDNEIAEELLQDLFIKLWDKRHQIDENLSFKAYLFKIVERMVYDHFRKLVRQTALHREIMSTLEEGHHPIEQQIYAKEIENSINNAIDQLPLQQQKIFRLCKIEGKSYQEVAKELGISQATINTHITRATKRIKEELLKNNSFSLTFYGIVLGAIHNF